VGTLTLPIASFYFTGNEGNAPVTVTFHNTSQYSDKWEWKFENGATSSEFEPTRTYYNNTGKDKTFLVVLTAIDTPTGESNTRSKTILVHPSN
jgi:PKD repeat protein